MVKKEHNGDGQTAGTTDLQTLFMEAVQLHQSKQLAQAEERYLLILQALPGNGKVLGNLGILYRDQQRYPEAEQCYSQALERDPDDPLLHLNLGAVQEARGELGRAASCFRRALELQPANAKALNNLGKVLCLQGLLAEAEAAVQRALRLEPRYPMALNNLGVIYSKQGKNEAAIGCLKKSLALQPGDVNTLYNLAGVYNTAEKNEEAALCLRQVVELDPNHAAARHMLAACSGATTESAPPQYVEHTFDLYAASFDAHLEGKLQYTVPAALGALLQEISGGQRFARAIDLGCGTGLSGRPFRDLAASLIGIDLSANMLARAKEKNIYDRLIRQDITAFLEGCPEQFDLFIATDVFIYVGKLDRIFVAVSRSAAPGAFFVFSIERADDEDDYRLRCSGRYAQSPGSINRLAAANDFTVAACRDHGIRREKQQWIAGNLFILKKNGPPPAAP
ncbi:MAG: tetratricopeptide repeat protein [Desulfobulbaceae bacterium]|nr:tetratricopeptide repeat protein [Desulfobulbaceae bacterium]